MVDKNYSSVTKATSVVLTSYPSLTNPGGSYDIKQAIDGVIFCSCTGWKMSKQSPKSCRHTIRYIQEEIVGL